MSPLPPMCLLGNHILTSQIPTWILLPPSSSRQTLALNILTSFGLCRIFITEWFSCPSNFLRTRACLFVSLAPRTEVCPISLYGYLSLPSHSSDVVFKLQMGFCYNFLLWSYLYLELFLLITEWIYSIYINMPIMEFQDMLPDLGYYGFMLKKIKMHWILFLVILSSIS